MPVPGGSPTTVTISDISIRVKRQFGDTANVQIDDTDIVRWVTDAMRDIALNNDLFQTIGSLPVVPALNTYALPTDILTLRSIQFNGIKLISLNSSEAETYLANVAQNTATGQPTHYWIWANTIHLYPIPDSTPGTLSLYYTRQPVFPQLVTDSIELPVQYHNRIVEYSLQQAYELDENWQAAQVKGQQFIAGVKTLKDNLTWEERDYYPSITSTPEDCGQIVYYYG